VLVRSSVNSFWYRGVIGSHVSLEADARSSVRVRLPPVPPDDAPLDSTSLAMMGVFTPLSLEFFVITFRV
jgi:hypothetical protein